MTTVTSHDLDDADVRLSGPRKCSSTLIIYIATYIGL